MEVQIINKEDFKPSTITIVGSFNKSIDIRSLANWMPVKIIYNNDGEREYLISGSRKSIQYYGQEGTIVSMCYQKIRRGMRTGCMNNMLMADIQYNRKNIHLKLSGTTITSVGTESFEDGIKVFELMTKHINTLKTKIDFINSVTEEDKNISLKWLEETIIKKDIKNINLLVSEIEKETEVNINKEFLKFCALFLEDENRENYLEKMKNLNNEIFICDDELKCSNFTIYNSVYHISPIKEKNFRMPLHRLAPFLASKGVNVEYHNWSSEGVNICFDIEEKKNDLNHVEREYRHRFSIHETTKIRQCSPTKKEEAYVYYLGVINLLKEFFEHPDVDFKKYVSLDLDEKENIKALKKIKNI